MDTGLICVYYNGEWVKLPTPSEYNPSYTHIENSYRDVNGVLHREIKRKNLAKIECGWNALNDTQIALLQNLYTLNSLSVRFTDNLGNRVTKTMYCGPLTRKSAMQDKTTLKIILTTEITMNFVEV